MPETIILGHLEIFVDNYKYAYKNMAHIVSQDGVHYSVPDRLMPPDVDVVDSMEWWTNGWAVGDNPRDRLCLRCGSKPLKKFHDYDEAVSFAFARQQKFKKQHVLVYVTKNLSGHEQKTVVRSLDDVQAMNDKNRMEFKENEEWRAKQNADHQARHPEFERLKQEFGVLKAWRVADFLASLRENGQTKTLATMSRATFYRYKKDLAAIGIELP